MKTVVALIVLILSSNLYSQKKKTYPLMENYYVNSDVKKENIPDDQFLLKGHVKMFSSALPLEGVLVSTGKDGKSTKTDSTGFFEINLTDTVSKIYFYKEGWHEFVIDRYKFRNGHEIDLTVYLGKILNSEEKQIMRKPVIYLYSEKPKNATVVIEPKGKITHSYPKYNEKWEVNIGEDGLLEHESKIYPYLFWEAETKDLVFLIKDGIIAGTVVASEDLTTFFEKSLSEIGLNDRERTDFITYWVPQLSDSPYTLIQFLNTEQCKDQIGDLKITPEPDNILRVYMLAMKLNSTKDYLPATPQEFEPTDRSGYAAVEWGGSIIELKSQ